MVHFDKLGGQLGIPQGVISASVCIDLRISRHWFGVMVSCLCSFVFRFGKATLSWMVTRLVIYTHVCLFMPSSAVNEWPSRTWTDWRYTVEFLVTKE